MGNRQRSFFGRPAFAALAFGLGAALFGPPLLSIPADSGGGTLWLYLFAAWAAFIAVLFAVARDSGARPPSPTRPRPKPPGRP
jgi:hypothetical protein